MRRIIPYVTTLVVFLGMDAVWLTLTAAVYRHQLGDLLAPRPRWDAAALFYLVEVLGIQIFVLPRAARGAAAFALGAAFGIFTYATYDLTNLAVLANWSYRLSAMDIAWGAVVCGTASLAGYKAGIVARQRFSRR